MSTTRRTRLIALAALALTVAAAAGCSHNSITPGVTVTVTPTPDHFALSAYMVNPYTKAVYYNWPNSGTAAVVSGTASLGAGTVAVTIDDAGGTQVYTRTLTGGSIDTTSVGTPGTWTVHITFTGAQGSIGLNADKVP